MTLSLIEVQRDESSGTPRHRVLLHPFFQPFLQLLRDHHHACPPPRALPDVQPVPDRDAPWLERDRQARFGRRAAWFLRLRWRGEDSGRMFAAFTSSEMAMFLQVLNDLRLFCWDRLGRPDPLPHMDHFTLTLEGFPGATEALLCVLEISTVLQNEIARTATSEEKGEPAG